MDWVALDFPSIDTTPGLRFINSHLEKNFADLYYIENWKFLWDFQIMALTFFKRENAC